MSSNAFELPLPADDEAGPYTLVGQAIARPGMADALEKVLVAMVAPTRKEQGALQYHVHRDRAHPDLFVFYEAWATIDDLKVHLTQPHVTAFLEKRMDYLAGEMDVRWLRMASPYQAL